MVMYALRKEHVFNLEQVTYTMPPAHCSWQNDSPLKHFDGIHTHENPAKHSQESMDLKPQMLEDFSSVETSTIT
jgi:hypothetical protein